MLDWLKICQLAREFLSEYSYKRLKLAQLLGQLGVFPTLISAHMAVFTSPGWITFAVTPVPWSSAASWRVVCFRATFDSHGPSSHYQAPLYIFYIGSLSKYTGWCMTEFTAHGQPWTWREPLLSGPGGMSDAAEERLITAARSARRQTKS